MSNSKKYLLVLYVILILAAVIGCSPSSKQIIESGKDITMFVATDIHYLAKDLIDNGEAFQTHLSSGDGKQLNYIDEIVSAFAKDINEQKPEILIISGDLTNNGEKESHLKLAEKLKYIEESAGTRVFVIPGNHDIQNPWARGFRDKKQYIVDTIDSNGFKEIYGEFGYKEAISLDKHSLSYLAAPSDDIWLLMLDTNKYEFNKVMGMPITNGMISSETMQWIEQCNKLAKEKNAQIVTVMHHNLVDHSDILKEGFTLDNNEEVIKAFEKNELNLILSGHIHIQDIKSIDIGSMKLYDIVTSSLGVYPQQYGVLKYSLSQGFDYSTSRVDIEGWAKEGGIRDNFLRNFNGFSKEYFAELSYRKTYDELTSVGTYTDQEKKLMAETMSLLNINYFGGTVSAVRNEAVHSPGYELWSAADEAQFLVKYVLSMAVEDHLNNNQLKITLENR
jgi:3',5'-cyclic AMP phosphodiesterase CpdA